MFIFKIVRFNGIGIWQNYFCIQWRIQEPTLGGGGSQGPKGQVEEGTGGVSPPVDGSLGTSPEKKIDKMKQNGAIWSANQAF